MKVETVEYSCRHIVSEQSWRLRCFAMGEAAEGNSIYSFIATFHSFLFRIPFHSIPSWLMDPNAKFMDFRPFQSPSETRGRKRKQIPFHSSNVIK